MSLLSLPLLLTACEEPPEEVEVISRPTIEPPTPKPKQVAATEDTTVSDEPEPVKALTKKVIPPRQTVRKVTTQETEPAGPTLPDSIERAVSEQKGQLNYCYEVARRADPTIAGRVDLAIVVSNGRVTSAKVASNATDSESLGTCLAKKIRRWQLEPGTNESKIWPFVFR